MKNKPPVSIFIITYLTSADRCKVLRRTCEVALAQNYPDFEVVVSDNGGEFSVHDALKSIDDPRLKIYRNEENVGFSGNMNRCLELCQYDIIKPGCDDDLIHPDFLTHTVPLVDDNTLVITDVERFPFGEEPEQLRRPIEETPASVVREPGYRWDLWNLSYEPWPSAMLFTRELYRSIGGCDRLSITADWDFCVEVGLYRRIVNVQHALCFIGEWPESLTIHMQQVNPFFYPHSYLYTEFRFLKCKNLPKNEHRRLVLKLLKEFYWQSLRPLRHPFSEIYRKGYLEFLQRFRQLAKWSESDFTQRPNRSV